MISIHVLFLILFVFHTLILRLLYRVSNDGQTFVKIKALFNRS